MKFSNDKLRFEKVSREQWEATIKDIVNPQTTDANVLKEADSAREKMFAVYDDIKLPTRATSGSVGYDFYSPFDLTLFPGVDTLIPTGIRVYMAPEAELWLMMAPKSGLGTKYKVRLCNTIGVIDSDYYNAKNEGHIMIKMSNGLDFEGCPMKQVPDLRTGQKKVVLDFEAEATQKRILHLNSGDAFAQGIFMPMITIDDNVDTARTGGFGSTAKQG